MGWYPARIHTFSSGNCKGEILWSYDAVCIRLQPSSTICTQLMASPAQLQRSFRSDPVALKETDRDVFTSWQGKPIWKPRTFRPPNKSKQLLEDSRTFSKQRLIFLGLMRHSVSKPPPTSSFEALWNTRDLSFLLNMVLLKSHVSNLLHRTQRAANLITPIKFKGSMMRR